MKRTKHIISLKALVGCLEPPIKSPCTTNIGTYSSNPTPTPGPRLLVMYLLRRAPDRIFKNNVFLQINCVNLRNKFRKFSNNKKYILKFKHICTCPIISIMGIMFVVVYVDLDNCILMTMM